MDTPTPTPAEPEEHLRSLAGALTEPRDAECVLCFADRMLDAFGCDGTLRRAGRWRDLRRPRATGLERRPASRGGHCDCEVFLDGWTHRDDLQVPGEDGEPDRPEVRPPCAGAGPRSAEPCANRVPLRRSRR
ncbi:DUF2695 domain-containing protein [Geodermatophilus sp. SYSU D00758]